MREFTKSPILIIAFSSTLFFSGCSNVDKTLCSSIKGISQDLGASLRNVSDNFSAAENDNFAQSLYQLRELSASNDSIRQPKALLENSIEELMSSLLAQDSNSASTNVYDMTVAIQSLNAACLILD